MRVIKRFVEKEKGIQMADMRPVISTIRVFVNVAVADYDLVSLVTGKARLALFEISL